MIQWFDESILVVIWFDEIHEIWGFNQEYPENSSRNLRIYLEILEIHGFTPKTVNDFMINVVRWIDE